MDGSESDLIASLKKKLEDKEKDLKLAAKHGLDLLEANSQLTTKLENISSQTGCKIEELEQQNYALKLRLETLETHAKNREDDCLSQEAASSKQMERLAKKHAETVERLGEEAGSLKARLESCQNSLEESRDEVAKLKIDLQEAKEQLELKKSSSFHNVSANTDSDLQNELATLLAEKEVSDKKYAEMKVHSQKVESMLEKSRRQEKALAEELQRKEFELTSQFNALERCRMEKMEIEAEIDQLQLRQTDTNRKGNSIFAEIEDHRQLLEKQVISLTTKIDTLKKNYDFVQSQNSRLKNQLAAFLSAAGSSSDISTEYQESLKSKIDVLKFQVSEVMSENVVLKEQLQRRDDDKLKVEPCRCGGMSGESLTLFFKNLYKESSAKVTKLEKQVEQQRFDVMKQVDANLTLKRKLTGLEKDMDLLKAREIQLMVKLDEKNLKKCVGDDNGGQKVIARKTIVEKIDFTKDAKQKEKIEIVKPTIPSTPKEKVRKATGEVVEVSKTDMSHPKRMRMEGKENIVETTGSEEPEHSKNGQNSWAASSSGNKLYGDDQCTAISKGSSSSTSVSEAQSHLSHRSPKQVCSGVKMQDTIVVHGPDGQGTVETLKTKSPTEKLKKRKVLREMTGTQIVYDPEDPNNQNQCSQQ